MIEGSEACKNVWQRNWTGWRGIEGSPEQVTLWLMDEGWMVVISWGGDEGGWPWWGIEVDFKSWRKPRKDFKHYLYLRGPLQLALEWRTLSLGPEWNQVGKRDLWSFKQEMMMPWVSSAAMGMKTRGETRGHSWGWLPTVSLIALHSPSRPR